MHMNAKVRVVCKTVLSLNSVQSVCGGGGDNLRNLIQISIGEKP